CHFAHDAIPRCARSIVYEIPISARDLTFLARGFGKDVVDIYFFLLVGLKVNRNISKEFSSSLHEKSILQAALFRVRRVWRRSELKLASRTVVACGAVTFAKTAVTEGFDTHDLNDAKALV